MVQKLSGQDLKLTIDGELVVVPNEGMNFLTPELDAVIARQSQQLANHIGASISTWGKGELLSSMESLLAQTMPKLQARVVDVQMIPPKDTSLDMPQDAIEVMHLAAGFAELGWELYDAQVVGDMDDLQLDVRHPTRAWRIRLSTGWPPVYTMTQEELTFGADDAPVLPGGWAVRETAEIQTILGTLTKLGAWLGLPPGQPLPLKVEAFFHRFCGSLVKAHLSNVRSEWRLRQTDTYSSYARVQSRPEGDRVDALSLALRQKVGI